MAHEIQTWSEIQGDFSDTLLLGNGASIAVHQGFRYDSLYQEAVKRNKLGDAAAVFKAFGEEVHDFELVLRRLWYAKRVYEALKLPAESIERTETAYAQVRNALIRIVQETHVSYDDASMHFDPIARFVGRFRTVFSLNYDLVLYWALMYGRSENLLSVADCFHYDKDSGSLVSDPSFSAYREDADTLCFYPHGNLVLARTIDELEVKVRAGGGKLLETIVKTWERGASAPLFVCDGTSEEKQRSIFGSTYLGQVYSRAFSQIQDNVVIYGWSMGKQDQHILDQVLLQKPRAVAVSIRNKNADTIRRAVELFEDSVDRLVFFDSDSPGAWNNSDGAKEREEEDNSNRLKEILASLRSRGQPS